MNEWPGEYGTGHYRRVKMFVAEARPRISADRRPTTKTG